MSEEFVKLSWKQSMQHDAVENVKTLKEPCKAGVNVKLDKTHSL